ncbi:XrtV sorting system accessory protein [Hyphococcus sp.]|uniref:XrtV sorting system accessory protein n=1 Tax=Hyphococcus sp. TaxID=2038636 RepID=UPI0035C71CCF
MFTIFDVFSLALLLASMGLFVKRYMTQDPPVYPYLIIASTCLVANWLGETGGGVYALTLLVAASFSFLGCLLYPSWRTMNGPEGQKTAGGDDAQ